MQHIFLFLYIEGQGQPELWSVVLRETVLTRDYETVTVSKVRTSAEPKYLAHKSVNIPRK